MFAYGTSTLSRVLVASQRDETEAGAKTLLATEMPS